MDGAAGGEKCADDARARRGFTWKTPGVRPERRGGACGAKEGEGHADGRTRKAAAEDREGRGRAGDAEQNAAVFEPEGSPVMHTSACFAL